MPILLMGCIRSKPIDKDVVLKQKLKFTGYKTSADMTYDFDLARVIKVYDGDTVTIAAEFNGQIFKFRVRIYGIDAEEMTSKDVICRKHAEIAKWFVKKEILGKIVRINVLNNKTINGRKLTEKYGRLLAIITYDGKNLADELLKHKLARPYDGKAKGNERLVPDISYENVENDETPDIV